MRKNKYIIFNSEDTGECCILFEEYLGHHDIPLINSYVRNYTELTPDSYSRAIELGFKPMEWITRQVNTHDIFQSNKVLTYDGEVLDIRRLSNAIDEGYLEVESVEELNRVNLKTFFKDSGLDGDDVNMILPDKINRFPDIIPWRTTIISTKNLCRFEHWGKSFSSLALKHCSRIPSPIKNLVYRKQLNRHWRYLKKPDPIERYREMKGDKRASYFKNRTIRITYGI